MRELKRPMDDLLYVPRHANFVVVLHVLPDDAALVVDVLEPVDEFIAAAPHFAFLGDGDMPAKTKTVSRPLAALWTAPPSDCVRNRRGPRPLGPGPYCA